MKWHRMIFNGHWIFYFATSLCIWFSFVWPFLEGPSYWYLWQLSNMAGQWSIWKSISDCISAPGMLQLQIQICLQSLFWDALTNAHDRSRLPWVFISVAVNWTRIEDQRKSRTGTNNLGFLFLQYLQIICLGTVIMSKFSEPWARGFDETQSF